MKHNSFIQRILTLVLAGFLVGAVGCSEKEDDPPPATERWRGELEVDQDPATVGGQWTDTVLLTINGSFYTLTHVTDNGSPGSLCDAEGTIGTLVSNTTRITPQRYFTTGACQANEGPLGEFSVVFAAGGDSLYLTALGGPDLFVFRLARNTPPPIAPTAP